MFRLPLCAARARAARRPGAPALRPRPARERRLGLIAGVLFTADLVLWHHAIEDVGAGLATVLGNLQVVLVAFLAWALLGSGRRTGWRWPCRW